MATLTTDDIRQVFERLDERCWQCEGSGDALRAVSDTLRRDCDICYGTGYQLTQAGIELLNFLRRQGKRIERERV